MDAVFRFLMEKTIDEDKAILESLVNTGKASNPMGQALTEFDWIIVQYRKKVHSLLEVDDDLY